MPCDEAAAAGDEKGESGVTAVRKIFFGGGADFLKDFGAYVLLNGGHGRLREKGEAGI